MIDPLNVAMKEGFTNRGDGFTPEVGQLEVGLDFE